jgi:hypothetical protein
VKLFNVGFPDIVDFLAGEAQNQEHHAVLAHLYQGLLLAT